MLVILGGGLKATTPQRMQLPEQSSGVQFFFFDLQGFGSVFSHLLPQQQEDCEVCFGVSHSVWQHPW